MMEQTKSGEAHHHIMTVCSQNDIVIANRAAGLCHIFYPALEGALDVITEREERIRSKDHIRVLRKPFLLLLTGKDRGLFGLYLLPSSLCKMILVFVSDVEIDRIVLVHPLDILAEGKV